MPVRHESTRAEKLAERIDLTLQLTGNAVRIRCLRGRSPTLCSSVGGRPLACADLLGRAAPEIVRVELACKAHRRAEGARLAGGRSAEEFEPSPVPPVDPPFGDDPVHGHVMRL